MTGRYLRQACAVPEHTEEPGPDFLTGPHCFYRQWNVRIRGLRSLPVIVG